MAGRGDRVDRRGMVGLGEGICDRRRRVTGVRKLGGMDGYEMGEKREIDYHHSR